MGINDYNGWMCTKCGQLLPHSYFWVWHVRVNDHWQIQHGPSCYACEPRAPEIFPAIKVDVIVPRSRPISKSAALTPSQWDTILWLQGNRCLGCGTEFSDEIKPEKDHVLPASKGGKLVFANTQALCHKCNRRKFTQHIDFRWWRTWNWPSLIMFIEDNHSSN